MLSAVAASFSGLVVNGPVARGVAAPRSAVVMMPVERKPGEGDPFNLKNGVSVMRRAEDIAVPVPNGISVYDMALAQKEQYIESEDEPWCAPEHRRARRVECGNRPPLLTRPLVRPWLCARRHATCRQKVPITKAAVVQAFRTGLPFAEPEEQLEDDLVPCDGKAPPTLRPLHQIRPFP